MQTAYKTVGLDFEDKEELIGSEYPKLLRFGDGPLRGFPSPSKRLLAHATRAVPEESLPSIRLASKLLTMLVAGYLAKEVAAILREITTLCIFYAPITGYSPSTRNYCTHRHGTTQL